MSNSSQLYLTYIKSPSRLCHTIFIPAIHHCGDFITQFSPCLSHSCHHHALGIIIPLTHHLLSHRHSVIATPSSPHHLRYLRRHLGPDAPRRQKIPRDQSNKHVVEPAQKYRARKKGSQEKNDKEQRQIWNFPFSSLKDEDAKFHKWLLIFFLSIHDPFHFSLTIYLLCIYIFIYLP